MSMTVEEALELDVLLFKASARVSPPAAVINYDVQVLLDAHVALSAEVKRLRDEAQAVAQFAAAVIRDGVWEYGELDGGDLQAMAEKLGLIVPEPYDREKHGDSDIAEPGCEWFEFSPWFSAMQGEAP